MQNYISANTISLNNRLHNPNLCSCSTFNTVVKIISVSGLAACVGLVIYLYNAGVLTSTEALQSYVQSIGAMGGIVFFLIQIVQVIIPIIPGGVSCLAGVVLFGAWKGFILNYAGICIGSIIVFGISKTFGRDILYRMFSVQQITKYDKWTQTKNRFTKLFAAAIFLPVAPDDFLCYLAGTTKMKWKTFITIIVLGKPLSIAAYSLGLTVIFQNIISFL
ncbi:MAG: VTT domain-containing protein [Clostridia bacterium]|nr:VTT domain-containing protein [Clostridia bacterium]